MSGDAHVRFCERLGVKFPGATHPAGTVFLVFARGNNLVVKVISLYTASFGLPFLQSRRLDLGRLFYLTTPRHDPVWDIPSSQRHVDLTY